MDVIAIHKALTQIWPGGIEREAYPVLAGLVKVLLDSQTPATLAPHGVPSTESLLELDGPQNGEKRPRPLTPKIKAARERIRTGAERMISPNPIDPDGRVGSKTLREVYLRVLWNPGSGASMIAEFLKISMYTAQRALGVLVKLKMIEGRPQDGIQNNPWVYTAI